MVVLFVQSPDLPQRPTCIRPAYAFCSNVDPGKPHPRWPQTEEKDVGTGQTRPTVLYNGYGEQVAALYDGSEH